MGGGRGQRGGARESEFYYKESKSKKKINLKKKSFFVGGKGWGEGVARVSEFFFTKNPNLKKNFFSGVGGWGWRVSGWGREAGVNECFYYESKF